MSIEERVEAVMRRVFKDDTLEISREFTAESVKAWDSLSHVQLILEVERAFSIRFRTAEIGKLRNVGDLIDAISERTA